MSPEEAAATDRFSSSSRDAGEPARLDAGATSEAVPDVVAPPEGNPRFPLLDGLRALAALSVLVFHAVLFNGAIDSPLGRLASHLDVGVTVFFVITGFLLYRPFYAAAVGQAPRTPAAVFYWRRIVRIVPAYWVALLVLLPLLTLAGPAGIANFLLLQTYRAHWARSGIAPAWSVCVEMSFYILLPLYAALLSRRWRGLGRDQRRRRELLLLGLLAVACLAFRAALAQTSASFYYLEPLPGTLAWFCIGMSLAIVSVDEGRGAERLKRIVARRPWALWLTALAIYGLTMTTDEHGAESWNLALFVGYGLIATLVFAPLVFTSPERRFLPARLLRTRSLTWLGLISYGIYLYHFPIMEHIHISTLSATMNVVLLAAAGAAVAIVCGGASYYIVERPALKLKRRSQIARLYPALTQLRDG